jgi:hypothetical protein
MMNYMPYYPYAYSPWMNQPFASIDSQSFWNSGGVRMDVGSVWVSEVMSEIAAGTDSSNKTSDLSLLSSSVMSGQHYQAKTEDSLLSQSLPMNSNQFGDESGVSATQEGIKVKCTNSERKLLYNAVMLFAKELGMTV